MSKVYLCGPISGALDKDHIFQWRDTVSAHLARYDIECMNPLRGQEQIENAEYIKKFYDPDVQRMAKVITKRDRYDTLQADCILVNLLGATTVSIGSVIEIGWADALDIPLVVVMESDNIHNHLMLNNMALYIVTTLDEGIEMVKDVLNVDPTTVEIKWKIA